MPPEIPNQSDNSPVSKDDIYDLLADDKPVDGEAPIEEAPKKEAKKDTKEVELDDTESGDEEKELEVEGADDEDEPEKELDLVVPARKKEILTKYPNLFKEFPYLEKAYYTEKKYTEMFGTISDAEQVIERSNTLSEYEKELEKGNTEPILKTIKENDPAAFGRLVDNYLGDLAKVDQNAFYHIVGNIGKKTILNMAQEGARLNNEHLKSAALVLNQFLFGNSQFEPEQKFSKEQPQNNEAQQQLSKERENFVREKFLAIQDDLSTKSTNVLKSTIENNIDPNGRMSDYVKRNAIRDCLSDLETRIGQDRQFRVYLDQMWTRAAQSNFSRDSTEKIKSAYLSKAKTYLRDSIQKARNEALKGSKSSNDGEQKDKRGLIKPGRSASQSSGGHDSNPKQIPKGMKTLDFLNQD